MIKYAIRPRTVDNSCPICCYYVCSLLMKKTSGYYGLNCKTVDELFVTTLIMMASCYTRLLEYLNQLN